MTVERTLWMLGVLLGAAVLAALFLAYQNPAMQIQLAGFRLC